MSATKTSEPKDPVWLDGYCVTIERGYRWLANIGGDPKATDYHRNRGHWDTAEAARAALETWLDENKEDPAYRRFRPEQNGQKDPQTKRLAL